MKKQGYRTGHFGKWHIDPKQTAGTYGIDSINPGDENGGPRNRQNSRAETELYDLSTDPGESTNLAGKHPEVVKELRAKIEKWNATLPEEYIKSNDNE